MSCEFVRRTLAGLACSLVLSGACWSRADLPPSSTARSIDAGSKAKFADALRLYRAGNFGAALPIFSNLADTTQSPNARLYVGHCLAQLGRHADAYRAFSLTVKEIVANPAEKYEQTREAAQAQLAILNVRVSNLAIVVPDVPPGFTMSLDEAAVQEKEFGSSIVVEPGAHHITASAPGFEPVQRDVTLEGGESKAIHVALRPLDEGKPIAAESSLQPPRSTSTGHGLSARTAGFIAGGVGVAGLAVFAIAGIAAKGAYDGLQQDCAGVGCSDRSHLDDIDHGKSLQTIANIGLVVGGVGIAAGGTLLLLGSREQQPPATAISLLPGGGTISYRGRF